MVAEANTDFTGANLQVSTLKSVFLNTPRKKILGFTSGGCRLLYNFQFHVQSYEPLALPESSKRTVSVA